LQSFDHCVSFHPHANHTLTHTCGVLHTYMINSINYIFFIFFKREHMLLWKHMQTMTKTSSKFTQKITHVDDMMIHNLVKYLVKIRLRLWDINITKFCQNIWTTFWLETRLFFCHGFFTRVVVFTKVVLCAGFHWISLTQNLFYNWDLNIK
jgi:hypothetical protein